MLYSCDLSTVQMSNCRQCPQYFIGHHRADCKCESDEGKINRYLNSRLDHHDGRKADEMLIRVKHFHTSKSSVTLDWPMYFVTFELMLPFNEGNCCVTLFFFQLPTSINLNSCSEWRIETIDPLFHLHLAARASTPSRGVQTSAKKNSCSVSRRRGCYHHKVASIRDGECTAWAELTTLPSGETLFFGCG